MQSQGGEDSLKEGVATHSSILAWRTPWTEEPVGLQSKGSQRVRHNRGLSMHAGKRIDNGNNSNPSNKHST